VARIYKRPDLLKGDDDKIDVVPTLRLVYRDTFNLKYFYLLLHEWFIDNDFAVDGDGYPTRSDEDFPETVFIHRNFGSDVQIWWRWRFERPSPTGPLFRWCVDVDVQILGLKQVETVVNGQKMKVDSAEFEIFITPSLFMTTGRWKKNPILAQLKPMLYETVYRKMRNKEKDLFENKMWQLQESVKTYFKLGTYLPERQNQEFHPKSDMTT
jgi:hypothetical protein